MKRIERIAEELARNEGWSECMAAERKLAEAGIKKGIQLLVDEYYEPRNKRIMGTAVMRLMEELEKEEEEK